MSFSAKNETNPAIIDATGYAPYIKARTERANSKGNGNQKANRSAQAVRDYWQREKCVDQFVAYSRDHEVNLFRNQWECEADRKALYSRVKWEMNKITTEMDKDLDKRRSRLADLLQSEEAEYMNEMGMVREDPEAKKDRMLSRYAQLKRQRDHEREKMAEEKKEQQFKRNCDELRALVSQKIQKETAEEGKKIIEEKEQEMLEKNKEDEMYAELWSRDREAKQLRESREVEEKKKKNVENCKFVKDQILKNKLDKQKKVREKEHDAAVMAEVKRLAELEEQYTKAKKKQKQAELKEGLDECTREKLKRRAKEVQEDLLQDLFFMKQIAESEEEAAKSERKRALMHEQKEYLKYLEDQIKAEAEFERRVDHMFQEELDKMWRKREKEWEEEKLKRRQREQSVLEEVQDQIRSNLERSQEMQALNKFYAQKIVDEDAEDNKRALEKLQMIRERNAKHQTELLDQIRQKEETLREEKLKKDLEFKAAQRKRQETEKKVQFLLSELRIDNEHPYRKLARELC